MTKQEAIDLFGGKVKDLAQAMGVVSQAISQWPDELPQDYVDRVIGAAMRLGKTKQAIQFVKSA